MVQRPAGPVDGNYGDLELMAVYVDPMRKVKRNGPWKKVNKHVNNSFGGPPECSDKLSDLGSAGA